MPHKTVQRLTLQGYVRLNPETGKYEQTERGARGLRHAFMGKAKSNEVEAVPAPVIRADAGRYRAEEAPLPQSNKLARWVSPPRDELLAGQRLEGMYQEKAESIGVPGFDDIDKIPKVVPDPTPNNPAAQSEFTNWKGDSVLAPPLTPFSKTVPLTQKVPQQAEQVHLLRVLRVMGERVDRYGAPQSIVNPEAPVVETDAPTTAPTSKPQPTGTPAATSGASFLPPLPTQKVSTKMIIQESMNRVLALRQQQAARAQHMWQRLAKSRVGHGM